jgi:hypothetical protein
VDPFEQEGVNFFDGSALQVLSDEFTDVLAGRAVSVVGKLLFELITQRGWQGNVHGGGFLLHKERIPGLIKFVKYWQ